MEQMKRYRFEARPNHIFNTFFHTTGRIISRQCVSSRTPLWRRLFPQLVGRASIVAYPVVKHTRDPSVKHPDPVTAPLDTSHSNDVSPVPGLCRQPEEDNYILSQWLQEKDPTPINTGTDPTLRMDTLPPEVSLCDTPNRRIQDVIHLLARQENLEAGQKALIDNGILRCDYVHASSGDLGRWFMNTIIRPSAAGRNDVCDHLEWLVSEIASVYPLSTHDVSYQTCLDEQTCRIIHTLDSLVNTYPMYTRLQICLAQAHVILSRRTVTHI